MELIRAFIAIPIIDEIKERVREIQDELKGAGARVTWVDPKKLHLTLRFLGNVEKDRLERVFEQTTKVVKDYHPFKVSFSKIGCFPRPASPRVIWVGVESGRTHLIKLATNLSLRLQSIGFEEEKTFSPHLTLGRVKDGQNRDRLVRLISKRKEVFIGEMEVGKVEVMRSELTPAGPIYTILKETYLF
ncbi:MAG: RNA 2',3'-cyclic phosphodiesterase [bacterium]|nr:RNA 2',3'-cyclic phosphodiesterase [bacterium]